jgi:hypothetical protein
VGKSTFGKIIGGANPLDISTPYDSSWVNESVELTGDVPGSLLIGPGQADRAERHWPELLRTVAEGVAFGIVNVVSDGMHSLAIRSYKEHDSYRSDMSLEQFREAYAGARRDEEIRMLKQLCDSVKIRKRSIWMVTVVNKQDLWWPDRVNVRGRYESGEYGRIVADLLKSLGRQKFQHEFLPCSMTLGNLTTPGGETLWPNASGYDQALHLQHMQTLFEKLYELIKAGVK